VRVTVEAEGGWLSIGVHDSGLGIAEADRERIFERFYRGPAARTRETGGAGAGLGLAIVRHVAANHGGTVTVASAEGEGSTFTLRLPLAPQALRARVTTG
jgi:two-component system sensor histidine kinase SenX3